jgi:hypothetical protein
MFNPLNYSVVIIKIGSRISKFFYRVVSFTLSDCSDI